MTLDELKKLKEGSNIYFKGKKFYCIGWKDRSGLPLCTREQYENFEISFAHINPDGSIEQFKIHIGDVSDLSVEGG